MGLYNFKAQFVPAILDGSKCQTIRAPRKVEDQPGDMMHLYTGLRQKGARLLKRVKCVRVHTIRIEWVGVPHIWLDGELLDASELDGFFRADGFSDGVAGARKFWGQTMPFEGKLYRWEKSA